MSVLCFGNIQFDVLCRPVVALPAPGEIRPVDTIDVAISGNAGSLSAVLARLGIACSIAGYSGNDGVGTLVRTTLRDLGVNIEPLLPHPTGSSGISVITLTPAGERSILIVNGVNEAFELDTVPDSWLASHKLISVQSVFLLPQFSGTAVERLFQRAKAVGSRTLLNICWDTRQQGLAFLQPALAVTDYFILNLDEGQQLSGQSKPEDILPILARTTPGIVILTLGAAGCCWYDGTQVTYVPALPVFAVDSTGAGDSFIAGFCAGIVRGYTIAESVHLGCATASFAVTGPGAYPRVPPLEEVSALAQRVYQQIH